MLSQYDPAVYCLLRWLSKDVKAMVDNVLPKMGKKGKKYFGPFHNGCDVCFMKMFAWDEYEFVNWMNVLLDDCKYFSKSDAIEGFCRRNVPKNLQLNSAVLSPICKFYLYDYVSELWKERRLHPLCIREIGILGDVEVLKAMHVASKDLITVDIAAEILENISKNVQVDDDCRRYLFTSFPKLKDHRKIFELYYMNVARDSLVVCLVFIDYGCSISINVRILGFCN